MIDFRVKSSGVILDIAPDATFQIENENPMFSDSRYPLAFSTEISFLPTQKNKEQMGYLAAMMLPPSVRELDVEVYASGFKIMDGMLRFSSVRDGYINYTFAGRSLEDDWGGKIFDKQLHRMPGDIDELYDEITDIMAGNIDGIYAPLLVNASETDKITIFKEHEGLEYSDCSYEVKYHNYPSLSRTPADYRVLTPAISVLKILENEMRDVTIADETIAELLAKTVILGQYKTDFEGTPSGIPAGGIDLARTLPDITALELLGIILKMFCCAIFRDAQGFVIMNASSLIGSSEGVLDWDGKISRDAELSIRPAGGYKFSYANDSDEDFNPNETVTSVASFRTGLENIAEEDIYQMLKNSSNGYVISARKASVRLTEREIYYPAYLSDLLTMSGMSYDIEAADNDGDVFDNSVPAKLARAVPDKLLYNPGIIPRSTWRMAAIINPESIGDERGSDVTVGQIDGINGQQQMEDGSVCYIDDSETASGRVSLTARSLFANYHEGFANWCSSAHHMVSASLELSMADIASLRMWRKVSFAGRTWFIKKITITFHESARHIDASAEFVSVS